MAEKVTISKRELECLREHLNEAYKILSSLGLNPGPKRVPAKAKRIPFQKGVENYKKLLDSGKKRTLPDHLKNAKATRAGGSLSNKSKFNNNYQI